MRRLILALTALLLFPQVAETRKRCGPGERAMKSGLCATLRPHSAVPRIAPVRPARLPEPVRAPTPVGGPMQPLPQVTPNAAPPPPGYDPNLRIIH